MTTTPTLGQVFATLPGIQFLLTPALTVLHVSRPALQVLLVPLADLPGHDLLVLLPAVLDEPHTLKTALRDAGRQAVASGQPQRLPVRTYAVPDPTAPGQFLARPWQLELTPVPPASGPVVALLLTVTEVAPPQPLPPAEGTLQTLLDNTPDVITRWSRDLRLLYANAAFTGKTGTGNNLLLGKTNREMGQPEAIAGPYMTALAAVFDSGQPRSHYNEFPTPHGLVYYYSRLVPEFGPEGAVRSVLGIARDITSLKQAEYAADQLSQDLRSANAQMRATNVTLEATNQRLVQSNADLDNFVYTASHDLKSPILNIEGLLALLREQWPAGHDAAPALPIWDMLADSIARFQRTISQLAEVVQLQADTQSAAQTVNLPEVVRDVQADLQPLISTAGAHVEVDVAHCPSLRVADKNARSIVYNLLSNALKYRHPARPPHVRLHCRAEGGRVLLMVQDNGLGLDESQQQQLFGLFRRFHPQVEDGTGVGLYMVKRLAESVGGYAAVASQPGQGTTFTVALPAAEA